MIGMSLFEIFCDEAYAEQEIDIIGKEKVRPYEILAHSFTSCNVVKQHKNTSIELPDGQLMSMKMFALRLYQDADLTNVLTARWEQILASKNANIKEVGNTAEVMLHYNVI